MTRLSLCMIVKNEGNCIERCLNSVKHAVDEMIIVDTGSSDDTINICRSAGASVFSYEWNDDFASARNYGLERATGDWIIWLDADEEVDEADAVKLKELLPDTEADLFSIQLINYCGKQVDDYHVLQMAHP
ncbi:glycosyltransferase family 2 protein, partial [Brevibacillus sp. 179-C9.3 HS]